MEKPYVFTPRFQEEEDGRWSAWLEEIPWCCTFGTDREDARRELADAAQVVVGALLKEGKEIPQSDDALLVVA